MSEHLLHDIKNRLFLITLLLHKVKNDSEVIEKINKLVKSISDDCLSKLDHEIDSLVNINQEIMDLTAVYPDLIFETDYEEQLEFIGRKSELKDVLINVIKNSHEARATIVKFKIKERSLVISDNGKCSKVVIDKLNNSKVFTTKENGSGIGSQIVRAFCEKHGCALKYLQNSSHDKDKKTSSMTIEVVFP